MPIKKTVITTSGDIISGLNTGGKTYKEVDNIYFTNVTGADATVSIYIMTYPTETSGLSFDDTIGGNLLLKDFSVPANSTAFNNFGRMNLQWNKALVCSAGTVDSIQANISYRNIIEREVINDIDITNNNL